MTDISGLEKRLENNPIYFLSLGSRELFHSNFLAWLLKRYPQMGITIFGNTAPKKFDVKREYKNLDLFIKSEDENNPQSIVVEVKVKDVPKIDQLERYDDEIENEPSFGKKPLKVLLSLMKVTETLDASSWRYLSFFELGQRILDSMPKSDIDRDHSAIIRNYAHLCRDLDALVKTVAEVDQKTRVYFFNKPDKKGMIDDTDRIVKNLRFADTLKKHRANALCEEIKCRVENEVDYSGLDFDPRYGFDRKSEHVTANLVLKFPEPSKKELRIGVHIQGLQYRRLLSFDPFTVASRKQGKNSESLIAFIEETDQWNWMFGSIHSDGYFENPNGQSGFFTGMTKVPTRQQKNKLLCSYAPRHIYQYTNIGEDSGVPIDKVVDAVIDDLRYAAQLLKNSEYVGRFKKWLPRSQ